MNKIQTEKLALKIIHKLIVYNKLDLCLKNIWLDELLDWLIENPKYDLIKHQYFNVNEIETADGISNLFNYMKNCINKDNQPKAIEQKVVFFDKNWGAKQEHQKIAVVKVWFNTSKKVLLSPAAQKWIGLQDNRTKQELSQKISRAEFDSLCNTSQQQQGE